MDQKGVLPLLKDFFWKPDIHVVALEKLKALIVQTTVLSHFAPTMARPIDFASLALTPTQQTWAEMEKRAIIFAKERFNTFVYARHGQIETYHKPLIEIDKKPREAAPRRLQRMLLQMKRYPSVIAEMAALMDEQQMTELTLIAWGKTIRPLISAAADDDGYQQLLETIKVGFPPSTAALSPAVRPYAVFAEELAISNGRAFKGHQVVIVPPPARSELAVSGGRALKGHRVIVPPPARSDILRRLHSSLGINGRLRRARESIYDPGLRAPIRAQASGYDICVRSQTENQNEPLKRPAVPPRPGLPQLAAQVMFGSNTTTLSPTTAVMVTPPTAAGDQGRQEFYRGLLAKAKPPLHVGSTGRARYEDDDWRKTQVSPT